MANEREVTDEQIVALFKAAAAGQEELTKTVGKMHDALIAMGRRLDLLQKKVVVLEQRLDRKQR